MTRAAKKNRLIILQLMVLAGLMAWIVSLGRQDRQSLLDRVLLNEQSAQSLQIELPDKLLEFRRDDTGWHMTKPFDKPANEQRLIPVLSLLTLPASHRYELSDLDASQLGLETPRATVRINHLSFDFGNIDASGHKRYLKTGNSVYLVDDLLFPLISSAPETFIAPGEPE